MNTSPPTRITVSKLALVSRRTLLQISPILRRLLLHLGKTEFTLFVAGIPSLKVLCRVTQTFGNKEAFEMIRAEGGKLVRPQAVDRIIVALDSCWPRKGAVVLLFHTLFVT